MVLSNSADVRKIATRWSSKSKNTNVIKKKREIIFYLKELKNLVVAFDENESDFLQNLYINSSDGNARSTKILELGENYNHAEYFFMERFFDSNIDLFYFDFIFKDRIKSKKDVFTGSNLRVSDILKGNDKNIISLYVFAENIAKNFNSTCEDRQKRNNFKNKIIKFYELIYRLFAALDPTLVSYYFDFVLHNYPLILIEFIRDCFKGNLANIEIFASDDTMLNFELADSENFSIFSHNELYKIASAFCMAGERGSVIFDKKTAEIFEKLFGKKIENFGDFSTLSEAFLQNFNFFGDGEKLEKFVSMQMFLEFASTFESEKINKNTIYYGAIGAGKTRKIRQILKEKNVKSNFFRFISFHKDFGYSDFIDGFSDGKFKNGEFKKLCKKALNDLQNEYFCIIDNANSGNFDEIFGESMELLERRYDPNDDLTLIRTKNSHFIDELDEAKKNEFSVVVKDELSYFAIPKNLYVICATNGYNRGISPSSAKIFSWVKMSCDYSLIENFMIEKGIKNGASYAILCKKLNDFISKDSRLGFEIGHGIFMQIVGFALNSQITQDSLNRFFASVLCPILECSYLEKNESVGCKTQISAIAEIFKV